MRGVLSLFLNQTWVDLPINSDNSQFFTNSIPESYNDWILTRINYISVEDCYSGATKVYPSVETKLEPHAVTLVPISFYPFPIPSTCVFLPKMSLLFNHGVALQASVISTETAYLPIANHSDSVFTITKNFNLGFLSDPPIVENEGNINALSANSEPTASYSNGNVNFAEFDINPNLSSKERSQLEGLLAEFRWDIFVNSVSELKALNCANARLELEDPSKIANVRPYRLSPAEAENLDQEVQKLFKAKIVEKSFSLHNTPHFLALKKDGSYRLLADFRVLNKNLKPVVFPIPLISEYLDSLLGSRYFSVFDFSNGYYQVELTADCRDLTSFTTKSGKFRYRRLAQGLSPAPAIFAMVLSYISSDITIIRDSEDPSVVNGRVAHYFDDLTLHSTFFSKHLTSLRVLFERLRDVNLCLSIRKTKLAYQSCRILGHVCVGKTLTPDPQAYKAVLNLKESRSIRDARSIFGYFDLST